ncbi:hypothetical protein PHJA_000930500 [Phtheirospermum japonicum]|uniref:Plant basic secretory protein (BSP) family protein n=1 Tax=Phtheirospermum japonicum TaxID=374723 RepID=A0A830BSG6_9LAMI|nr:hypothetical protein PHJA_000930500 [Phtheirospermum japonicum]
MENHRHHHLRPLLHPSTTTPTVVIPPIDDHEHSNNPISSNSSIVFRLSLVAFIGIVSIWANHEASKGYAITIVNESGQTLPGNRFQLFYVSNDEATRITLKASQIIESFLYSDNDSPATKKPIGHMILKLAGRDLTDDVTVDSVADNFVLNISPSILEGANFDEAMILAIRKGVARVWLWDGQGNAPTNLINGIVEYIILMTDNVGGRWAVEPPISATACWKHDDLRRVAGFLGYCERRRPGFIRRLNGAMKDGWDDGILDGVLGRSVENMCTSYHESLRYNISSV